MWGNKKDSTDKSSNRMDEFNASSIGDDNAENSTYTADYRQAVEADEDNCQIVENLSRHTPEVAASVGVNVKEPPCVYRRKAKYKTASFMLIAALICIGAFSVAFNNIVSGLAAEYSASYDSYNSIASPLVMADINPFEEVGQIDMDSANCAALTKLLFEQTKEGYASYDSKGSLLIPAEDVKSASKSLFGPGFNLFTQSPKTASFYSFTPEDNMYHVAACTDAERCIPFITRLKETSDALILYVGYIPPTDPYRTNRVQTVTPTPEKQMEYTLKKDPDKGSYYVASVTQVQ